MYEGFVLTSLIAGYWLITNNKGAAVFLNVGWVA